MSRNNDAKVIFEGLLTKWGLSKAPGNRQAVLIDGELWGLTVCWGQPFKIRQFYEDYCGWLCYDASNGDMHRFPGKLSEQIHDASPNRIMLNGTKAYTARGK